LAILQIGICNQRYDRSKWSHEMARSFYICRANLEFSATRKKFNNQAKCYEDWPYVNFDCTSGGDFEGVREQDILPTLFDNFFISKFVSFGNIPDVFIDRAYGPNFSPDEEDDCRLIDYLDSLNTHLIDMGIIEPTMMIATLQHSGNNCLFENWSPSFSVRKY
jgi:hypothetical protein